MAWTPTQYNSTILGANLLHLYRPSAYTNAAGMILDGTTEKLGIRYIPSTTSPITSVDVRLNVAWTGSPATFKIGVFSESSLAPNDASQLGSYTANWTAPAAAGWIGLKSLTPNNTGNLTVNTPVWIVIEYVSGTLAASTDFIQTQWANSNIAALDIMRHYNGTNWTTTSAVFSEPYIVVSHADGTYAGLPVTAVRARSGQADIYLNTTPTPDEYVVQGIRFKTGSMIKVVGVNYVVTKSGSPSDLVIGIYEGDQLKYSNTIPADSITNPYSAMSWLSSPVLLAADTNLYIILSQGGGSDTADYDLQTITVDSTAIECMVPSDVRFVYGSQATIAPSSLSVSSTEIPMLFPIISDPATDLDQAAAGGLLTHPGMAGGLRG